MKVLLSHLAAIGLITLNMVSLAPGQTAGTEPEPRIEISGETATITISATDTDFAILDSHPEIKEIIFPNRTYRPVAPTRGDALEIAPIRFTRIGFAHLANCKDLEIVKFGSQTLPISDRDLNVLSGLTKLRVVHFGTTYFTDAGIALFAGSKTLTDLEASDSLLGDSTLQALSSCKTLERLKIGQPYAAIVKTKITDKGVAELAKLSNLKSLDLSALPIGDASLVAISQLTKLEVLDLSRTKISDNGVQTLQTLSAIHELHLRETSLSSRCMPVISGFKHLALLDLAGTKMQDAGITQLEKCTDLETLVLTDTAITDAALEHIVKLPKLASLDINGTPVTDAGVRLLGASKSLRRLSVGNKITDEARNALNGVYVY